MPLPILDHHPPALHKLSMTWRSTMPVMEASRTGDTASVKADVETPHVDLADATECAMTLILILMYDTLLRNAKLKGILSMSEDGSNTQRYIMTINCTNKEYSSRVYKHLWFLFTPSWNQLVRLLHPRQISLRNSQPTLVVDL